MIPSFARIVIDLNINRRHNVLSFVRCFLKVFISEKFRKNKDPGGGAEFSRIYERLKIELLKYS